MRAKQKGASSYTVQEFHELVEEVVEVLDELATRVLPTALASSPGAAPAHTAVAAVVQAAAQGTD